VVIPPAAGTHPYGVLRVATSGTRSHLSRLARSGRAFLLAPRLYVEGSTLSPEAAVRHHVLAVIEHVWPGEAVLCDRSGLHGPTPIDGWMFVCHPDPPRRTDLALPGLVLSPRVGPGPLPGDIALAVGRVHMAGSARSLVENISAAGRPTAGRPARRAGTAVVEDRIEQEARTGGIGRIRTLLSELDVIAGSLPARPVEVVRARLAELLGTRTGPTPASALLAARLDGEPFDAHRLDLLSALVTTLARTAPMPRPALGDSWQWEAFFEAYFSNYIEGTEFGVDEARRIAIDGEIPVSRPTDAHDFAATHRLVSDPHLARQTPTTGDELLDLLRERHAVSDGRPTREASRPIQGSGQLREWIPLRRTWPAERDTATRLQRDQRPHRPPSPGDRNDVPAHRMPPL